MQYLKDKQDLFKARIKARKKEMGFKTAKKNDTGNKCEWCLFFNAFSPSLNRCTLISFEFERVASIGLESTCSEWEEFRDMVGEEDYYKFKKYELIDFKKIKGIDVAKFKMEGVINETK